MNADYLHCSGISRREVNIFKFAYLGVCLPYVFLVSCQKKRYVMDRNAGRGTKIYLFQYGGRVGMLSPALLI